MHVKRLTALIALVFGGPALAAPADITLSTPDYSIILSGAPALDPTLMKYVNENVCGGSGAGMVYSSTPTWSGTGAQSTFYGFGTATYTDANGNAASGDATNHYAIFCTANGPDGVAVFGTGKKVLVIKRSAGGSYYGVGPVIDGVNPSVYDPTDTNGLMAVSAASCTSPLIRNRTNCTGRELTNAITPHAGLSDIEGPVFSEVGGTISPTSGYPAPFKSGLILQGFAVAVSTELNDALVAFQFTGDGTADPVGKVRPVSACGITATAWDSATHRTIGFTGTALRTAACQPTLSRMEVANASSPVGNIKMNWAPLIGALGVSKPVNVCRHVDTSGTEMAFRTYFLNSGSNGNLGGQWVQGTAAQSTATRKWYETTGASNMKDCLNHVTNTAAGDYALGYMSLANTNGGAGNFNFVKINGVSGNYDESFPIPKQKQAMIDGSYDFAYETVAYVNSGAPAIVSTFITSFYNETKSLAAGTVDGLGLAIVPKTGATYVNGPTRIAKGSRKGNSFAPLQILPTVY